MLTKRFIDEHPGKFSELVKFPKKGIEFVKDHVMTNPSGETDEHTRFLCYYVMMDIPLENMPEVSGIDEKKCSSWAADTVGTYLQWEKKFETTKRRGGMDIYEYAETHNADYLDQHTGYIYKVQEYRNYEDVGLPNPGIRVTNSYGKTIGYAKRK